VYPFVLVIYTKQLKILLLDEQEYGIADMRKQAYVAVLSNAINQDETLKKFADRLLEQVGGAVNGRGVSAERRSPRESDS